MQDLTIWTGWGRDAKEVNRSVVLTILTHQVGTTVPNNRFVVMPSSMGRAADVIAQYRPGCIIHAQGMVFAKANEDKVFLYMRPTFIYIGHTKYMADNPREQQEQHQEDESLLSELSTVCLHKPMQLENEAQTQLPTNHVQITDDRAE